MKIVITEGQYKTLLNEVKDYYDFWDINYVHDTIQEFLDDKKKGIKKKKWRTIPFEQYRNALIEFMRYGEFMRFPSKYIDQWADIVTENTLSIQANTELAGHTQYFPYDDFCDAFGFEEGSDEYKKYYKNYEDCAEFLYEIGFDEWTILPDGSDAISDYGIEPLYKLIMELEEQTTPEEKIVVINKILDVYHMRGDLASAFIEGGSKSLSKISRTETINEQIKKYLSDLKEFWGWISPSNELTYVPRLRHKDFIMNKYKTISTWDYDEVFNTAIKDGWVRVIYEYNPQNYKGMLSINTYDEERLKEALLNVLFDLIKYGSKTIYMDYEYPKEESKQFSTHDSASKLKLKKYLNME